jgi:hypothetical protein
MNPLGEKYEKYVKVYNSSMIPAIQLTAGIFSALPLPKAATGAISRLQSFEDGI